MQAVCECSDVGVVEFRCILIRFFIVGTQHGMYVDLNTFKRASVVLPGTYMHTCFRQSRAYTAESAPFLVETAVRGVRFGGRDVAASFRLHLERYHDGKEKIRHENTHEGTNELTSKAPVASSGWTHFACTTKYATWTP